MPETLSLSAALLLGVLGSTHCVGMCGGISGALAFALGSKVSRLRRYNLLLLYSVGRVSSYAFMGALVAGLAGVATPDDGRGLAGLRVLAGAMLVLMGLNLAGWSRWLVFMERAGQRVWRRIQGGMKFLLPVDHPAKALLAGALWGWLPCGLVYSTLVWAGTSGGAVHGALLMCTFGLGTIPAVMASGAFALQLRAVLQRRGLRIAAGLAVVAFGVWTLLAALPLGMHAAHSGHHG